MWIWFTNQFNIRASSNKYLSPPRYIRSMMLKKLVEKLKDVGSREYTYLNQNKYRMIATLARSEKIEKYSHEKLKLLSIRNTIKLVCLLKCIRFVGLTNKKASFASCVS